MSSGVRIANRRFMWGGLALLGLGLIAVLVVSAWVLLGERPAETSPETPDEATVEMPTETTVEMPNETPAEKPAEATVETSTATSAEKPVETPAENPAEKPSEKPAETTAEKPTETTAEKPTETPAEKPAETKAEKPAAKPIEGLPSFEEVMLDIPNPTKICSEEELRAVLEPVGKPFRLVPGPNPTQNKVLRFQGLARIQGWTPESVLRLANTDGGNFQRIHVWGQKQGVSLCWYQKTGSIGAYRTLQKPGQQEGVVPYGTLLATDDGRDVRLPVGPYLLRYQDGAVVLSQGNIPVLTVAMEEPVTAVYFESLQEMDLRDLSVVRAGPGAADAPPTHRLVFESERPADLSWKENIPAGARLQRMDDGSIELSAEKATSITMATVPVPGPGLYTVVFQVEDATAGSGIALFDGADQQVAGIEYGRDRKNRLTFNFGTGFDFGDEETRPTPYAGSGQWLRLVMAGGMTKCSVSNDGVHWGKVLDPVPRNGAWRTIGLYVRENVNPRLPADQQGPDAKLRRIRLRRLEIRELDGLTGAVSAELLRKAALDDVSLKANESVGAWMGRVASLAPKGCSAADWTYACTLQALAGKIPADTAQILLNRAVNERLTSLPTLQAKMHLLEDASLLDRIRPEEAPQQLEYWDRLGRDMIHADMKDGFDLYQKALMDTSMAGAAHRTGPISRTLITDTLLLLYAEQRWQELERFLKQMSYWTSASPSFRGWLANENRLALYDYMYANVVDRAVKNRPPAFNRPQPLLIPVSKVTETVLMDVQGALDAKEYKEAARLLTNAYISRDESLTPAPADGQLLLSFRAALRLSTLCRPEFTQAMNQQIGPADELKIQQAMQQGDPVVVEALIAQYHGTSVATSACQWLGDRSLATNDLVQALLRYQEAIRSASSEQRPSVLARIRLVSAMLGKPLGEPIKQPAAFGDSLLAPDLLERKIQELALQSQTRGGTAAPLNVFPVITAPQPVQFQISSWVELSDAFNRVGPQGDLPEIMRRYDWSSGHLLAVPCEDLFLLTNRKSIVAIDMASGTVRWSCMLGNASLPGPLRPLVHGQKIYIRSMTMPGKYGVICLDRKTGRGLWQRDCEDNVISDPLLIHGRLYCLTFARNIFEISNVPLSLAELNPDTGELLSRRRIGESPNQIGMAFDCQTAWLANRLVVLFSGTTMCLDLQGKIQWMRQTTALSPDLDPTFPKQQLQPPYELDGRLYVRQPGSCAVECLSPDTGEVVWRRGVAGLQEILDLNANRILVKGSYGLAAIDPSSGRLLWRREIPGLLSATAGTTGGQILCAYQQMFIDKSQLTFLWLDSMTGQTKAHSTLPMTHREALTLGPIVVSGNRVWCCGGRGIEANTRPGGAGMRISSLEPAGPAADGAPL